MQILIDTGLYWLTNQGYVAMLQVAYHRLQERWPSASIYVTSTSKNLLARYCPGASLVAPPSPEELQTLIQQPRQVYHACQIPPPEQPTSMTDAFLAADLIVGSGGGYISDMFEVQAKRTFHVMHAARLYGKPVALFGQGLGPLNSNILRARAAYTLPLAELVGVRESQTSPDLLKSLGVRKDRTIVTGDDAIEPAYSARCSSLGDTIGITLSHSVDANVSPAVKAYIRTALRDAARQHHTTILPIAITQDPKNGDGKAMGNILPECTELLDTNQQHTSPTQVIEHIGRCRIVVTTRYHSAVFALAQGIPAVCLAYGPYYRIKFQGLQKQFGAGCEILFILDPNLEHKLPAAIEQAWNIAEQVRPQLLQAARQQIEASHSAYQQLYHTIEAQRKVPPPVVRAAGDTQQPMLEIVGVPQTATASALLQGYQLEHPQPGERHQSRLISLRGWCVGQHTPVVAIEVLHHGVVIQRGPVNIERPDIGQHYPLVAHAAQSGFCVEVYVIGPGLFNLHIQAVLADQQRVVLGSLNVYGPEPSDEFPLVSVITPCYRQAHFLSETIASVMEQTYPNIEYVVVDDGSPDNTAEVVARYPGVRYIWQPNQERSVARNTGLRHTRGEYVMFLDSDDRLLPLAVATNIAYIRAYPECAMVSGHWWKINSHGAIVQSFSPEHPEQFDQNHYLALLHRNYIGPPLATMFRRSAVDDAGWFNPKIAGCEDFDMYLKIAYRFPTLRHPTVIAEYRTHATKRSLNFPAMLQSRLMVLHQHRSIVRVDKAHHNAYASSVALAHKMYGEPTITRLVGRLRSQQWRAAWQDIVVLLRWYPRGLLLLLHQLMQPGPPAPEQKPASQPEH